MKERGRRSQDAEIFGRECSGGWWTTRLNFKDCQYMRYVGMMSLICFTDAESAEPAELVVFAESAVPGFHWRVGLEPVEPVS